MSWSKKRRSPGWASSKVATRTAGSAIASSERGPRRARARAPAGRRTRVRCRTRLPSRTRPVASRLAAFRRTRGPEREERRRAVRLLPDDAGHGEGRVADGERVAGREAEPPEDGLLDHDAAAGEQLVERPRGHGLEPPVERIAAVDRLQLDEERAAPGGVPRHRHQLPHPGHGGAAAREVPDRRLRRGVERAGRAELDVPAEEGARLAPERAVERRGHAQDGHEGADPERDAREEAGEVPPRAARLPPGEAGDEAPGQRGAAPARPADGRRPHAAARSPTTRPSRSSTTRSAWAARAGSWVTRISVVPWRRWRPTSRSTIWAPVAESRLPVGSSASTRPGRFATARASATRCCSPPDSSAG